MKRGVAASTSRTPLPASADPDLIALFDERVRRMFVLLDGACADAATVPDFRAALHQVAGTAAFFGRPALGSVAGTLNARFAQTSAATPAALAQARAALQQAATEGAH